MFLLCYGVISDLESCLEIAQLGSTLTNMKIFLLKQQGMIAQNTLRQYVLILSCYLCQ